MDRVEEDEILMRERHLAWIFIFILVVVGDVTLADVDFDRDIRPILSDNCYPCHGPDAKTRKAKLRLDVKEAAFRVTSDTTIIAPGRSSESELVRRVTSPDPGEVMPPPESNLHLSPEQVEALKRWVDEGAKWAEHWAFLTPRRPRPPTVADPAWSRGAIDRFVLARLEREGLSPADEAPRETLIRRVTLDLTGLPPTPEEVDAFLADASPDAYERVVEKLLASPRYGERMVWEWLAAARYADSNGYQGDAERSMWPWRDWAAQAMNDNMPYDQFTIEQLAGDLLPDASRSQRLATAFNRNHMINSEGGRIPEENRVEYGFDQIETFSTVWLGMTVGCARCHDHKFDPLTQREYFQLFAFFNNTPVDGGNKSGIAQPILDLATPDQQNNLNALQNVVKEIAREVFEYELKRYPREEGKPANESPVVKKELPKKVADRLGQLPQDRSQGNVRVLLKHMAKTESGSEYHQMLNRFLAAIVARDDYRKTVARAMVMEELDEPRDTFILERGAYDKPGEKVNANLPAFLPPVPRSAPPNRLGLAQWAVHPEHPLTARVTVNRYWQLFFGTGLVKTVEDFGVQGEKPSHPELLDWLAVEFARSEWDVKGLHRLLVNSATYRQSSRSTAELGRRDPDNRLLARGPRYRLPSFMIRDQALALSGLLVEGVGGLPVNPYQPTGVWEDASFGEKKYVQDRGARLYRRSLYTFWRRIVAPTMFFDAASRQTCTVQAKRTNTPLHALVTLNDVTFVEAARLMAERILTSYEDLDSRVELAYRLATSRRPNDVEKGILTRRLGVLREQYGSDPGAAAEFLSVGEHPRNDELELIEHVAWTGLCSLLLNLDETISRN